MCKYTHIRKLIFFTQLAQIFLSVDRYAEGQEAGTQHSDTALLVQKSTQRMNSLKHNEPDSVSEQEVDDLLAWTNALDFDE